MARREGGRIVKSAKLVRASAGGRSPGRLSASTVAPKRAARDPEGTRQAILSAAIDEFAREGYAGGRIERISKAARSHDRMVYYYFGSKEGLFRSVIEAVYEALVTAEQELPTDTADPIRIIEMLVEFNWRYYIAHPELISVLNSENIHKARHIKASSKVQSYSSPQLAIIENALELGRRSRLFKPDVTAEQVFLTIASLSYFYLSNIHTLSNYLRKELGEGTALQDWLKHIKAVVVTSLLVPPKRAADSTTSEH